MSNYQDVAKAFDLNHAAKEMSIRLFRAIKCML